MTSGGPPKQRRDHSIVQARSVWTLGLLEEVVEGSWGLLWALSGLQGALQESWGFWKVPGGSLRGPWDGPWEVLEVPGEVCGVLGWH